MVLTLDTHDHDGIPACDYMVMLLAAPRMLVAIRSWLGVRVEGVGTPVHSVFIGTNKQMLQ